MPRFGRRNPEREWEAALGVAREELAAGGDAIGVLDIDVQSPGAPAAAADRFGQAMLAFMRAGERLERASDAPSLVAVGEALEQTRYELAGARALLDGAEAVPPRSAPCLFDPAHGPSVTEVAWEDRLVPSCAHDAERLAAHEHPHVRLIAAGKRPAYYWDVPFAYGALIEGYFAAHGGVPRLATLLAGTPLGDALRPGS